MQFKAFPAGKAKGQGTVVWDLTIFPPSNHTFVKKFESNQTFYPWRCVQRVGWVYEDAWYEQYGGRLGGGGCLPI